MGLLLLLLSLMYPGQNYLQTLIIKPGKVRSYHIPPLPTHLYPVADGVAAPPITSEAVIIQDADTKTLIFAKNPDTNLMPASTTKIMTALVALDHYSLTDQLTIHREDRAVGSSMKLVQGEVLTVQSLLYGLLVASANDAALALADSYPGGYDAFISAMNQKAKEYHLESTNYVNVSGVENYSHLTSARDLAVLAAEAVKQPVINSIMQTQNITVTDVTGTISHELVSTNQLLGRVEGVLGLKTGWTEAAGECLVTYVSREGRNLVIVVLNSRDRFGETTKLIDWVFAHHVWQPITP